MVRWGVSNVLGAQGYYYYYPVLGLYLCACARTIGNGTYVGAQCRRWTDLGTSLTLTQKKNKILVRWGVIREML